METRSPCGILLYFSAKASAEDEAEHPAHYREDDAVEQRRPEAADLETVQEIAGDQDDHSVDHKQKQSEGEQRHRDGDKFKERLDKDIKQTKHQREQYSGPIGSDRHAGGQFGGKESRERRKQQLQDKHHNQYFN